MISKLFVDAKLGATHSSVKQAVKSSLRQMGPLHLPNMAPEAETDISIHEKLSRTWRACRWLQRDDIGATDSKCGGAKLRLTIATGEMGETRTRGWSRQQTTTTRNDWGSWHSSLLVAGGQSLL